MVIPPVVHETIKSVVNDNYVNPNCTLRLTSDRSPQPEAAASLVGPVPFDQKAAFRYTWDMMEAHHRASMFLHDSMQGLYLH